MEVLKWFLRVSTRWPRLMRLRRMSIISSGWPVHGHHFPQSFDHFLDQNLICLGLLGPKLRGLSCYIECGYHYRWLSSISFAHYQCCIHLLKTLLQPFLDAISDVFSCIFVNLSSRWKVLNVKFKDNGNVYWLEMWLKVKKEKLWIFGECGRRLNRLSASNFPAIKYPVGRLTDF